MRTENGVVFLNTGEAAKHVGWCYKTFQVYAKALDRHTFPGDHGVYYRETDLAQFLEPVSEESLEKQLADVARIVLRNTPLTSSPG